MVGQKISIVDMHITRSIRRLARVRIRSLSRLQAGYSQLAKTWRLGGLRLAIAQRYLQPAGTARWSAAPDDKNSDLKKDLWHN